MAENARIEDLRRRVQKDPASIAFAQLAEEYRRAGQHQESVDACRAGLALHPSYLSARVTLGRALIELGQFDEAERELGTVLKNAPENLAAIRGIADIHHKRGDLAEALKFYRSALALARNDPDLEQTVAEITRQLAPSRGAEPADGLSLEHLKLEISARMPTSKGAPPPVTKESDPEATVIQRIPPALARRTSAPALDPGRAQALKTIAALEQWLTAINVARAERTA
jgi:tetratricopeptide (TPR) repeat protein